MKGPRVERPSSRLGMSKRLELSDAPLRTERRTAPPRRGSRGATRRSASRLKHAQVSIDWTDDAENRAPRSLRYPSFASSAAISRTDQRRIRSNLESGYPSGLARKLAKGQQAGARRAGQKATEPASDSMSASSLRADIHADGHDVRLGQKQKCFARITLVRSSVGQPRKLGEKLRGATVGPAAVSRPATRP
jgi:hypothetical protein